jgi:hypothetical protein
MPVPKRLSRREFLQASLVGIMSAPFTRLPLGGAQGFNSERLSRGEQPPRAVDIIVIGAGVAGRAAANLLVQSGLSIHLLEARLAPWQPTPATSRPGGHVLFDQHGAFISPARLKAAEQLMSYVFEQARQVSQGLQSDASLADILTFIRRPLSPSPDLDPILYYLVKTTLGCRYGAELENLSAQAWQPAEPFSTINTAPGSAGNLQAGTLHPGCMVSYACPVQRIEQALDGIDVFSAGRVFKAKAALLTLPLGVLRRSELEFIPTLPGWKLEAIRKLGVGVINQVQLQFPAQFWPPALGRFGINTGRPGEWRLYQDVSSMAGQPTLQSLHPGSQGVHLEQLTDDEIVAGETAALRLAFSAKVPLPDWVMVTRCTTDLYARGMNSFLPPGSSAIDRLALARPLDHRLFFAGEATSVSEPATLAGAYRSGQAAARLIQREMGVL